MILKLQYSLITQLKYLSKLYHSLMQQVEVERQYADEYTIHLLLGEGGQASVYLGSLNNEFFALKLFLGGANHEWASKREAEFLKNLNFKHLINLVDYRPFAKVKLQGKSQELRPMIILEFAERSDVCDYISKLGGFIPEVCRFYFKQLLSAIQYLANHGVTHRDIKPDNILFDRNFCLRVSDFGHSRDAHGDKWDYRLRSKVGTEGYRPPEMNQKNYTGFQADLFAAGVTLFCMYRGGPPFLSTEKQDRIYRLIRENNFAKFWAIHEKKKPFGFYSPEFKKLIESFFSVQIDRRPTLEDLQKDEWLNGDQIQVSDLKLYMQDKFDKLTEKDPNRQKIASIKKSLYLSKIKEGESNFQEEKGICFRGEYQETEDLSEEQIFVKEYRNLTIDSQQLPQYTKNKVVYVKENPSFVVAWLKNFLDGEFKAHQTFMDDFVSEILPLSFNLSYLSEKHEVRLELRFQIDEQDETQLIINGKLHKSDRGEIGIEWQKENGNVYWLSRVQAALNSSLEGLLL